MARKGKHEPFTLSDGRKVPFGFKVRGGVYYVRFPDPADPTRYRVITTEQTTEGKAYPEAGKIILAAYMPEEKKRVLSATWETVLADLETSTQLRDRALEVYTSAISVLRKLVVTTGPGDVDEKKANQFRDKYQSTGFTKSNKSDATVYPRTPKTVANAINRLDTLWSKYLRRLHYVTSNPWEHVERPTIPETLPEVPDEGDFAHFLTWFRKSYPDYLVLHRIIEVKMLAGCRLKDVCSIRAEDFDPKAGTVRIRAEDEKTHKERVIPLPADLVTTLQGMTGPNWLWESYTAYRPAASTPGRRNYADFDPLRLYWRLSGLFTEYNEANPDRTPITSHDLRRRAVTLLVEATGSVDVAADAVGMTSATARKHYLDAKKAFDAGAVLKKHADILRPKA